jgi:two-component system OmpR family sensor kinase
MAKSLYTKLAVVLLALFCAVTGVWFWLTVRMTRLYLDEATQKLNRGLARTIALENPPMHDWHVDRAMLDKVFDALMAVNPNIEIYLLDRDGRMLAFSAPPGKVKRDSISLAPVKRFLSGAPLPIRGDDPRDDRGQKIFSVTPLPAVRLGEPQPATQGYLYVILGGEQYDSAVQRLRGSFIMRQSAEAAAAALLFVLVTGLLLFALMTRRLRNLSAAMEAFKRSDFTDEMRVGGREDGDEVDRLAATFDEMSSRIVLQVAKLKEVDLLRRELVANVSHDLRTPLASLRGYLDTLLLKEDSLSAEERRKFLEIASKHSIRLGRLVDELFELAKLDAQVAPIRREPFSMPELVQDVVQKFQLRAEQTGVRIGVESRADLPLVSGDLALMERVLENLIENAIRYTPSGGSVTVALIPEDGRLIVRVSDTGCGIAEESLPYIFDRFYRGDDAASRADGAGLGLAIARRIVELHGSSLSAQSRLNAGTTFIFAI